MRAAGRNRVLVNRIPCSAPRDLLDLMRVTIFAPDDLAAGEGWARRDDATSSTTCSWRSRRGTTPHAADYERVLRHRNALLRGGCAGRGRARRPSTCSTSSSREPARELVRGPPASSRTALARDRRAYGRWPAAARPSRAAYEAEWARTRSRRGPRPRRRRRPLHAALGPRARRSTGGHARRAPPRRVAPARSTASTPGPTRLRASSARSRSRCGSPATGSSADRRRRTGAAARRRVQRARRAARGRARRPPRPRARPW